MIVRFYLSGAQSRDKMAAYTASGDLEDSAAGWDYASFKQARITDYNVITHVY